MTLSELFQKVIKELHARPIQFALAGGMVASIYRTQPRTTADLDFLLYAEKDSDKIAKQIIRALKLEPLEARQAQLEGGPQFAIKKKSSPLYIIVGRVPRKPDEPGVDFILPAIPWFKNALERAQKNLIDFGFGRIPCLTPEDILISKLYSLWNDATRTDDLSDLKSIFENKADLDLGYISSQMRQLNLHLPPSFEKWAPNALQRVSKNIKKDMRRKNKIPEI